MVLALASAQSSCLHSIPCCSQHTHHFHTSTICKPSSPSLVIFLRQIHPHPRNPRSPKSSNSNGFSPIRAYMEDTNPFSSFSSRVIGSLPIVGLLARILSDEGGVGGDLIDFAEFRRRVGNKCSMMDSGAFYEFQDRRGRVLVDGGFWRAPFRATCRHVGAGRHPEMPPDDDRLCERFYRSCTRMTPDCIFGRTSVQSV